LWKGSCGLEYHIETNSPAENEMVYCPRCGKRLMVKDNEQAKEDWCREYCVGPQDPNCPLPNCVYLDDNEQEGENCREWREEIEGKIDE